MASAKNELRWAHEPPATEIAEALTGKFDLAYTGGNTPAGDEMWVGTAILDGVEYMHTHQKGWIPAPKDRDDPAYDDLVFWGEGEEAEEALTDFVYSELDRRARARPTKVAAALDAINKARARKSQPLLDPQSAGWSDQDVLDEAARISRPNPQAELKKKLMR